MGRLNHFIVLMQENRSFDHLFGCFPPPAGPEIENILALDSPPLNLLNPSKSESARNPRFAVSQPAPFAVDDKDGPSHSFNSVNVQLTNDPKWTIGYCPDRKQRFRAPLCRQLEARLRVVDRRHDR